jgi:hypothetical protein
MAATSNTNRLADGTDPLANVPIKWKNNFNRQYAFFHLKKSDYGREFLSQGKKYVLVGAMGANAKSNPLIVKNMTTNKFQRFPAYIVQNAL